MSKHTPGPWNTMVSGGSVWSSGGQWVCDPSDRHAYPTDTQRANARLIAAAPEMLLALQQAHDALLEVPTSVIDDDIFNTVEHAIEKAKGEVA